MYPIVTTAKAQLRQSHVAGPLPLFLSLSVGCSFFDKCTRNISLLTGAKTELDTIMSRYTTRLWYMFGGSEQILVTR